MREKGIELFRNRDVRLVGHKSHVPVSEQNSMIVSSIIPGIIMLRLVGHKSHVPVSEQNSVPFCLTQHCNPWNYGGNYPGCDATDCNSNT